jgi:hypothetical protein
MRRTALPATGILSVLLALAAPGCSSGGGGMRAAGEPNATGAPARAPVPGRALTAVRVPPRVVKTARISIEVDRGGFESAIGRASVIAGRFSGYVETTATRGTKTKSGRLVIRVPVEDFAPAVHGLEALGEVQAHEITGRDVSFRFVDIEARLRNLTTQEGVLRRLLAGASTVSASLRVQSALSDVQLQIERLVGERNALANRADLSTIELDVFEPGSAPITQEGIQKPRLQTAFDSAIAAFLAVIYGLIVGLGVAIPLAVFGGIGFLIYRVVRPGGALGSRRERDHPD